MYYYPWSKHQVGSSTLLNKLREHRLDLRELCSQLSYLLPVRRAHGEWLLLSLLYMLKMELPPSTAITCALEPSHVFLQYIPCLL